MKKEIVLFLSSQDSLESFPYNEAFDFSVQLPDVLHLDHGEWYCTLKSFQTYLSTRMDLYVFTNIIEESVVRDKKLPVLQHIPGAEDYVNESFDGTLKFKLNIGHISMIRIYIKNTSLENPSFGRGPSTCTLQITREK